MLHCLGAGHERSLRREQVSSFILAIFVSLLFLLPLAESGENGYTEPAEKDKCPVCGMFVAKYPDWIAEVRFRNGGYAVFDGPKDLIKYLADIKRYAPDRRRDDVQAFYVMDYYAVRPIDGSTAFYVEGSEINGPMGAELIPFEKESDAREFLKDHRGNQILRFKEITPAILKRVE